MKLTCAVIDDEPLAVELIESYVRKTPFLEHVASFYSATAAFGALRQTPVDLLFCDIQMPELNGMEFARMLPVQTRVVFTTAFSNYAVDGFRVNAVDYLLKPISYGDFLEAAEKALQWFEMKRSAGQGAESGKISEIYVKADGRLRCIALDRILYIEGLKDYVKIYVDNEPHPVLSLISMKSLEDELPSDRFVRVHRSWIIQPSRMSYVEKGRVVYGSVRIPVSDSYRQSFYDFLAHHSLYKG